MGETTTPQPDGDFPGAVIHYDPVTEPEDAGHPLTSKDVYAVTPKEIA